MKISVKALAATIAVAATIGTGPAEARGFIAGALKDLGVFNEEQRRALDRTHEAFGKPLDRRSGTRSPKGVQATKPAVCVSTSRCARTANQLQRRSRPEALIDQLAAAIECTRDNELRC